MKQIPDLQDLINIKAENRLDQDLKELCKLLKQSRLLSVNDSDTIPNLIYKDKETKPYWLFQYNGKYMNAVKEYWLPIYQNEESQNFIKQVEQLNENIADLMNSKEEF